jgi:hypothetical protein
MLVQIAEDRELRREIELQARIKALMQVRDMCLRHAQTFDHGYSNASLPLSERLEARGRAIEAADIAETLQSLLNIHSRD